MYAKVRERGNWIIAVTLRRRGLILSIENRRKGPDTGTECPCGTRAVGFMIIHKNARLLAIARGVLS